MDDLSASRGPAAAATLTSSSTSFVTWAVSHYVFGGMIPPEVYGFLQLVVPAGLGWASACAAHRREDRRRA